MMLKQNKPECSLSDHFFQKNIKFSNEAVMSKYVAPCSLSSLLVSLDPGGDCYEITHLKWGPLYSE